MSSVDLTPEDTQHLIQLLEHRIKIIGNSEMRETDPDRQLAELKAVSEQIFSTQAELSEKLSPRLKHFLEGCSYEKALHFLKTGM